MEGLRFGAETKGCRRLLRTASFWDRIHTAAQQKSVTTDVRL
jgi:hypothetical protein